MGFGNSGYYINGKKVIEGQWMNLNEYDASIMYKHGVTGEVESKSKE